MLADFNTALDFVSNFDPPTFDEAHHGLNGIECVINLSDIYHHYHLGEREEFKRLITIFDPSTFAERIIDFIDELFPVLDEALYEEIQDGTINSILVRPQGLNNFSDDETFELWESVENYTIPPIAWFLKLLDTNPGPDAWDHLVEVYNIPCEYDDMPGSYTEYLDLDLFRKKSKRINPYIIDALEYATGAVYENPFYVNMLDYYDDNSIELNIENIELLKESWEEAKKISNNVELCQAAFDSDPQLYKRTQKAWKKCIFNKKDKG
ncbi:MAG: hypothetical protein LWX83_18835 [Anaerolineae bacterium]|nr:hypothetical protein [Anaerolineae bacterium]